MNDERKAETKVEGGVIRKFKEKIRSKIGFPYLLLIIIVAAIILLFALGVKVPFGNEETPIVDKKIIKFLNLYYGLINITINNKTFENGVWKVNVNAYTFDGIGNYDVYVNANDFTITKVSQNLVIPSKPSTIRETGKTQGCSVGDRKTVDVYIDPYDPWSIKYDQEIEGFISKFENYIRLNYRIVPTYSYDSIIRDTNSKAYDALLYYQCAKGEEYFKAFKSCVISKYNEKKDYLSKDELGECVISVGGNIAKIENCTQQTYPRGELSTDQRFAETFLGAATTPIFVVDCKYIIYPLYIENAFCYLYPEIKECKE
ncbi:MAG: hypothetical protein NZ903_01675 [Candidatus Micrarchaeota archaeon]|nr:hypothetical protein [Candidatus Micrarchaeota archaeon]